MLKNKFIHTHGYTILKLILIALSVYFFVVQWQSMGQESWRDLIAGLQARPLLLALIILLMLVNWLLEAMKFKLLLRTQYKLTPWRAWMTVFAGTTISNFTPARTGDYLGRTAVLKTVAPLKVVMATISGNLLQVFMTYALGILSFGYLLFFSDLNQELREYRSLLIMALVLMGVVIGLFTLVPRAYQALKRRIPAKLKESLQMVVRYPKRLVLKAGTYSLLRYLTFSVQFFLLLQLFSADALGVQHIMFIPAAYLLQSLVPVPAITDIGFRVYFSVLLFGQFLGVDQITMAVTSLWFINLILPGLIGALYLLYSLFDKS